LRHDDSLRLGLLLFPFDDFFEAFFPFLAFFPDLFFLLFLAFFSLLLFDFLLFFPDFLFFFADFFLFFLLFLFDFLLFLPAFLFFFPFFLLFFPASLTSRFAKASTSLEVSSSFDSAPVTAMITSPSKARIRSLFMVFLFL